MGLPHIFTRRTGTGVVVVWLGYCEAELGIEVYIVVPGQPVGRVQLAARQGHHLREAGRSVVDLVDDPLRHDDRHIALDLDRSTVRRKTLPRAFRWLQGEGTAKHLLSSDEHMHQGRRRTDIRKP